jgi:hypothetical protein
MSGEIGKLEAEILNVQTSLELIKKGFERHNAEMGLRISNAISKLPEAKKVLVRTFPLQYDDLAVYADFSVALVNSEAYNENFELSESLSSALKTEIQEFYHATASLAGKWKKLKTEEHNHMTKLAPFTEIEMVRKNNGTHAHIYTVREDKVYAGTLLISSFIGAYVPEQETDVKSLEARRFGKCPMYIARHPSRLASHDVITRHAIEYILNSLKGVKK